MTEQHLHKQCADYLIAQYPRVIFRSDLGGYTNRQTAVQKSPGYPDMTILLPMPPFHGLLIELKDGYGKLFNKDGSVAKKRRKGHVQQAATLWFLLSRGYFCDFVTSFNEFRTMVDFYLDPEAINWRPSYATKLLDWMWIKAPWDLQKYLDHPFVYEYWGFRNGNGI